MQHDPRHRLTSITDPAGNVLMAEYDDRDLLVAATSALGIRHEYRHDLAGLVVLARVFTGNPAQTVEHGWQADFGGRLRIYTDPEGNQTRYDYNLEDSWTRIVLHNGSVHQRIFNTVGE